MNKIRFVIIILGLLGSLMDAQAQPGAEIELKKPKKYENRKLGSEKTNEKKFTVARKLYQNTVTHYNYYFNANNRLNDLVNAAKGTFKEDYSQLLPFYNYSLQATSQNKQELDSIIYKCTAGILLHDLRNSYIDNMYLVLAKAYFFRNDLDSAGLTLQYLNFSFAPKEEGGYDIPIGSNASNETGEFSIATKEKNSIFTKLTSRQPSRNESFVWQIRNFIEKDELPEAAGVIEILRADPNFPKRLQTDLHEVLAYWFYKQQLYDSAAFHLDAALDEAKGTQEKARWEYLIAQMYQLAKKDDQAILYYNKSIDHTIDPVLDVYARLNSIRINHSDEKDYLQENIDALHNMAKRDKYVNYRDIIYYAAANIELERSNYNNAQADLLKSVHFSNNNPAQRSQSFLLLADLNYTRKTYPDSYNFYDSLELNALANAVDKDRVTYRKPPLKTVAENTLNITAQDSLQSLAILSPEERDAIIKKQVKKLRKVQGLEEEDEGFTINAAVKQVPDLFVDNSKSTDFYFYNASQKARGFSEFKAKWGERANVDNWRRKSAIDNQVQKMGDVDDVSTGKSAAATEGSQLLATSYEGMQANIPLTQEKMEASNNSIMESLFTLGTTFMNKLEEYPSAIQAFEELLRRFPDTKYRDEALFNLVYAFQKTGDLAKADLYKKQLTGSSTNSKWAKLISNPNASESNANADAATRKYEDIYTMFLEGNFEQAKSEKKVADSLYGNSFWTPQLLFIESIYYIKQQEDSTAIKVLTDLATLHAKSPMAARAKTMIDVLKRRKEIEGYLTNLDVKRNEDKSRIISDRTVATTPPPVQKPAVAQPAPKTDTASVVKTVTPVAAVKKDTTVTAAPIPTVTQPVIKNDTAVVVKAETPLPAVKKDTTVTAIPKPTVEQPVIKTDTAIVFKKETPIPAVREDTIAPVVPDAPVIMVKGFSYIAAQPHYVVVLLEKVDPVYAAEAKNAFNRFNKEKYYNQQIEMNSLKLGDTFNLVLQGPFTDAKAAVDYIDNVKPVAKSRILPWLPVNKYSFIIVSEANLELLKANKDMDSYKQLLQQALPGKF